MWTLHAVTVFVLILYCLLALTEVGFTYDQKPPLQNSRSLKNVLKVVSVIIIIYYILVLCIVLPIVFILMMIPVVNLLMLPILVMLAVMLIPLFTAMFLVSDKGYLAKNKKTVITLIYSFLVLLLIVHGPVLLYRRDVYKDLHVKIAEKGGMMSITSPTTTINKKKTTSKDKKVTVGKKKALKK
jgi:hypothetical protein